MTRKYRAVVLAGILLVWGCAPMVRGTISSPHRGGTASAATANTADTSIFAPLTRTLTPLPNAVRLATGAPGPKYWQNRADYELHATLDTTARVLRGTMVLHYTNNSPHMLDTIWLQTERAWAESSPPDPSGEHGQGHIQELAQIVAGKPVALQLEGYQTVTKAALATPLKPGATAAFYASWDIPGGPSEQYEVTQWYPRVCVYDDVKGWNTEPWVDGVEYYLEYGDYTLEVTLPAGYIVAATGMLRNPREVLSPTAAARLALAATADTVVHIITASDVKSGAARPAQSGMLTWKFSAKHVRDAVWVASPLYQWDATSWNGVLTQAYYRLSPQAQAVWAGAADMVRQSIQEYSEHWLPYPYPQATVADALNPGMEYPMLAIVSKGYMSHTTLSLFSYITHEVGHNWFPMVVGSNERTHGWMDEGFNTFINSFSETRWYPQESAHMDGVRKVRGGLHLKYPIETPGKTYQNISYAEPAAVLSLLRRDILGPALFDKAMRTYIRRWAYKHPTPADFFRTIEDISGRHLDWFWREWIYEPQQYDQAIGSVTQTARGNGTQTTVTYLNRARGVLPIRARLTFNDGSTQDVAYSAEVWRKGPSYTVTYTIGRKTLTRVELDPDRHFIDAHPSDNQWPVQPPPADGPPRAP